MEPQRMPEPHMQRPAPPREPEMRRAPQHAPAHNEERHERRE
ncbi:MAG TPA: hypothetical protein PLL92_02815 [Alicycliphilus sp.]|nr:hypothetical protein [Alicycliphilus sp.]